MTEIGWKDQHGDRGHVLLGWGRVAAGGLDIYEVPGDHLNMLERPYVQTVAEKIEACLNGHTHTEP